MHLLIGFLARFSQRLDEVLPGDTVVVIIETIPPNTPIYWFFWNYPVDFHWLV
jgi:hypothetical protein